MSRLLPITDLFLRIDMMHLLAIEMTSTVTTQDYSLFFIAQWSLKFCGQ